MPLATGAVEVADGGYRLGLRTFSLGSLPPEAGLSRYAAAASPKNAAAGCWSRPTPWIGLTGSLAGR